MSKSDAIVGSLKEAAKAGIDVDEALDQLSDLVELAHKKDTKPLGVVLSEVPLGYQDKTCVVGWDTCSKCSSHVSKCACKGGPTEPIYVSKFRQEKPVTVASTLPTPVSSPDGGKSASPIIADPVLSDGDEAQSITAPPGFLCTTCNTRKPFDAVDKNDDDTFTCHLCQAAS